MGVHAIVGAGPIGTGVARILTDSGRRVRMLTRSGSGLEHDLVERVSVDAADAHALRRETDGAEVIYNCVNPQYHRWPTQWPPIAAALLGAAQAHGAVLVTASNLYGYGPVSAPMTEDMPLAATSSKGRVRARMWRDALEAHDAGRIRATEVRGSDYVGSGAVAHLGERVIPRVLKGKKVQVFGDPDQPHTWTYTRDMARLLVTVGQDERAWGRAWHTPSNPPRTQRQALADVARLAEAPEPRVGSIPPLMLRVAGWFNPAIKELADIRYQFVAPFILDSSAATETFGMQPTPWDEVLQDAIASFRQ